MSSPARATRRSTHRRRPPTPPRSSRTAFRLPAALRLTAVLAYSRSNWLAASSSATCYALSVPDDKCINQWLGNTSGSGTLRVHPAIDFYSSWINENANIPDGWTVERHVVATKALAMASWEDVGRVIGADGNVYSTIALAEAAGTTAEAMIAYLGAVDGACEHGLPVLLTLPPRQQSLLCAIEIPGQAGDDGVMPDSHPRQ